MHPPAACLDILVPDTAIGEGRGRIGHVLRRRVAGRLQLPEEVRHVGRPDGGGQRKGQAKVPQGREPVRADSGSRECLRQAGGIGQDIAGRRRLSGIAGRQQMAVANEAPKGLEVGPVLPGRA